ncbi:type II toxin-antitoxin system PemK/MazF family toxin [Candidatus Saccharibacteria bacterium]|nr:type II toxin-antitoxin system PemK/MazF family toxin [Candidatus Saccharibacteria bacterium]
MDNKRFNEWIKIKSDIHFLGNYRSIKEGDVWWCAMGENVGVEINGKHEFFMRPVLVLKKLSRFGFMAVPLTSQPHEGTWYVPFVFKNKQQNAVLAQARTMSVFRLLRRIGMVPKSDLELVREGFKNLYC